MSINQERFFQIIYSPYISEKATKATEMYRQHAFKVAADATKPQIKDAIEFVFNTKVESVSIVNMKRKIKTFKGREGQRKAWKKAYVTLYPDQKLDLGVIQ